jgi:hypothetical protein
MTRARCYLAAAGVVNALGNSREAVTQGLLAGDTSGMVLEDGWLPGAPARVGRVTGVLPPGTIAATTGCCCSRWRRSRKR